ncbi:hypothetical protein WT57_00230 [Burkholderia pseudomultivorans]|uniref:Uncharacterized protein n=1 Tax=Burkholderia pseudomultivorans TaxID=1207504 RepID=A0A132F4J3_9BURK|nr:hypothetical protein WT57_00230 [Burkholderia pseudomultivorans]
MSAAATNPADAALLARLPVPLYGKHRVPTLTTTRHVGTLCMNGAAALAAVSVFGLPASVQCRKTANREMNDAAFQ